MVVKTMSRSTNVSKPRRGSGIAARPKSPGFGITVRLEGLKHSLYS